MLSPYGPDDQASALTGFPLLLLLRILLPLLPPKDLGEWSAPVGPSEPVVCAGLCCSTGLVFGTELDEVARLPKLLVVASSPWVGLVA